MTKILIVAEHDNKQLRSSTHHVVTAATQLSGDIEMLICGFDCQSVVEEASKLNGVNKIYVANNKVYEHQLAENVSQLIAQIGRTYQYILMPATTFGKNILPRVAALLDVAMLSDVVQIISPNTFVRPIYAGNALATVQIEEPVKLLTIRTTTFHAASDDINHKAAIEELVEVITNELSHFEHQELTKSVRPDLTAARVVISGGRGLKSAENFHLLESIADKLDAALGASRAAVDAGFAPNDYQVGQTGKVVAPELYIAVGISGAIQHLAGMKDSKVIVAINNDPEAPIFQIADYGLVGDLFKILPELDAALAPE
jgi:electron transfer flavoprotein alpha subunit